MSLLTLRHMRHRSCPSLHSSILCPPYIQTHETHNRSRPSHDTWDMQSIMSLLTFIYSMSFLHSDTWDCPPYIQTHETYNTSSSTTYTWHDIQYIILQTLKAKTNPTSKRHLLNLWLCRLRRRGWRCVLDVNLIHVSPQIERVAAHPRVCERRVVLLHFNRDPTWKKTGPISPWKEPISTRK